MSFSNEEILPVNGHSDHGIFENSGQSVARMMYSVVRGPGASQGGMNAAETAASLRLQVVERASHDGWIAWCGFALLATGSRADLQVGGIW